MCTSCMIDVPTSFCGIHLFSGKCHPNTFQQKRKKNPQMKNQLNENLLRRSNMIGITTQNFDEEHKKSR